MKLKKLKTLFLLNILGVLIFSLPLFSFAQNVQQASQPGFSLVQPCSIGNGSASDIYTGNSGAKIIPASGSSPAEVECGWGDLIVLFQRVISYLIFIGTTLCAVSIAYAGFLYMTSVGNMGQIEKAHRVFTYTIIGLLFIWGGWLLVATILKGLGVDQSFSLVNLNGVVTK